MSNAAPEARLAAAEAPRVAGIAWAQPFRGGSPRRRVA
jgi:hypothetical protein